MASGYGLESPSPGGARSQGKGHKINTGLRGLVLRFGCPLAAERPLYSELVNTRHEHDVPSHPTSPLRAPPPDLPTPHPKGFPSPPGPPSCSLSDGQATSEPIKPVHLQWAHRAPDGDIQAQAPHAALLPSRRLKSTRPIAVGPPATAAALAPADCLSDGLCCGRLGRSSGASQRLGRASFTHAATTEMSGPSVEP